ncbi:unnamed protein product [Hermetia illucens]|uniref:Uncharacterized protein n=1 Tax=Hermetia illucens TaxID=343691 RepID=A0A7R8YPK6_HERIL|nr:unnamed protein product [Hermetia illucens]
MPLTHFFNRVYYKKDLEELEQAARRLNTLIQLQNIRNGNFPYFNHEQARRRIPMTRDGSFETDPKIKRQTDQAIKTLHSISYDFRHSSMQEIIHKELLALEKFKERLSDRRARRKRESKLSMKSTKSSLVPKRQSKFKKKTEVPHSDPIKKEESLQLESKDSSEHDLISAPTLVQTKDTPLVRSTVSSQQELHLEMNDLANAMKQMQTFHKMHRSFEGSNPTSSKVDDPKEIPTVAPEVKHGVSPVSSVGSKGSLVQANEINTWDLKPAGDQESRSLDLSKSTAISLTSSVGMTVQEALRIIKQNYRERQVVLLISPLPGESLGNSPFLQVTALCRSENRLLGSFQIPNDRLHALDEGGIFKRYTIIFLSTSITFVQHDIDAIVGHLTRITRGRSGSEKVSKMFELAELHGYHIRAHPAYEQEEHVYKCDFFTSRNSYIGTTRVYGSDVLRQLREKPKLVNNFDIIVELNDGYLPSRIRNALHILLKKLGIAKLYERVGSVLFKIFKR